MPTFRGKKSSSRERLIGPKTGLGAAMEDFARTRKNRRLRHERFDIFINSKVRRLPKAVISFDLCTTMNNKTAVILYPESDRVAIDVLVFYRKFMVTTTRGFYN